MSLRRSRLQLVATVTLIAALSACGGSSGGGSGDAAAVATTAPAAAGSEGTATTAAASGGGSGSGSPTPTGDDREHLIYVLEAVNPRITQNEDALVKKSMTVCAAILGGKSSAGTQALATKEFTNGSYKPSPEEAKAIDATIVAYFCR